MCPMVVPITLPTKSHSVGQQSNKNPNEQHALLKTCGGDFNKKAKNGNHKIIPGNPNLVCDQLNTLITEPLVYV